MERSFSFSSPGNARLIRWVDNTFFYLVYLVILCGVAVIITPIYILYLATLKTYCSFLYEDIRLGKDKKTFVMYKIRTLVKNADSKRTLDWHSENHSHELWYGSFLRKTKLDELPQVINLFKGEMKLLGPRPVRPYDYRHHYAGIPGCDKRFSVLPGLTGISQLYTPGGTPRRYRVIIENHYLREKKSITWKALFITKTILLCFKSVILEICQCIIERKKMLFQGKITKCRRHYDRNRLQGIDFRLQHKESADGDMICGKVLNINKEYMLLESKKSFDLEGFSQIELLYHQHKNKKAKRLRKIVCPGVVKFIDDSSNNRSRVLFKYDPSSEFSKYRIDKDLRRACLAG